MNLHHNSLLAITVPLALVSGCVISSGDGDDSTTTASSTSGMTDPTTGASMTDPTASTDPTADSDGGSTAGDSTADDSAESGDEGDSSGDPPMDTAMARVMHLGVGVPAVDIFANGTGPIIPGLEFRQSSVYAPVPPGDYTFEVALAGMPVEEAILMPMLTLEANTSYTAVAIGDIGGDPAPEVIALVDDTTDIDAANVRVTAIHAAPGVGEVDIWEVSGDPVLLLENVAYGQSETLDDLTAMPYVIGLDLDDDMVPDATFTVDVTALAGSQINLFASNDPEGNPALVAQLPTGDTLTIDPDPA